MLITKQWSDPKPIIFGKNILVRSSHSNFAFKIFSAKGECVEGIIKERIHIINADNDSIRMIRLPMISFRANTNDELHVDFEMM